MSEPQHNRPIARDRLARALKANMARRKVASLSAGALVKADRQSLVTSETSSKQTHEPCVAEGEPRRSRGQRSVGGESLPSGKRPT